MSQSDLAQHSGVSVRSIRGLENGQVTAPHTSTLLSLAAALDLPRDQADRFLRSWDRSARIRSFDEVMATDARSGLHHAMREGLMRSFLDKRVIMASRLITVGRDRRIHDEWYQIAIEALSDQVDSHLVVARGLPHEDVRLIRFEDLVGCSVRHRNIDRESNMLAVELSLGESLRTGEVKSFAWREVNGWAGDTLASTQDQTRHRSSAPLDTKYTNAFLRPFSALSMQIDFSGDVPRHIWEVSGGQRPGHRRPLRVDRFGTTGVVWQNGGPGRYGIAWSWE